VLLSSCGPNPVDGTENRAPTVTIVSPLPGTTFAGGDVLEVEATGADPDQGPLPSAALEWWVVLHHATHTHPILSPAPGASATLPIPRVGHLESDIFYRIYVRATDAEGSSDTAFVDVAPRLMSLTLTTVPAGLQVTLDHQPRTTPLTITGVVGMERVIGAPSPQAQGGNQFEFSRWAHGGGALQTLIMPEAALVLTASFSEAGTANVPPSVTITAPAAGSTVTAGTNVRIEASAQDADGTVTRVEFFEGSTRLGEDAAAPFALDWTPGGPGQRTLTARAIDNHNAVTVSPPVAVTVQAAGSGDVLAPVVTLTSPAPGTLGLVGSVQLSATATDNVGVTLVEFAVDGELLATSAAPPFVATVPSTAAYASGAHVLRARARDAAGNWSDWAVSPVTFGGAVALPSGFTRTTYASGFGDLLTAVAVAPDGRLFVAEKSGRLRVVKQGQLLPLPFVALPVLDGGERGLLGVALHPNFSSNGFVYLYYTTADGGAHNRISRFVANGDVALAGGEEVLVDLPLLSGASKHNGGAMAFGVDGKLYVAVGDNADGSNAPTLTSTFGKMLRFNADGSIPQDNPFLGQTTGINQSIWARGLRNPFTFAIEPGTGRMHINDVGAEAWEEINLGRAGADYGWPATEGPTTNPLYDAPILAYGHGDSPSLFSGRAAVGAAFYHPPAVLFGAAYLGHYFFADYVDGWIYRMDPANGNAAYAFANTGENPTGLAIGNDGALYVLLGTRVDRIAR
jgi:glucose/arabinose dehydrogenase